MVFLDKIVKQLSNALMEPMGHPVRTVELSQEL